MTTRNALLLAAVLSLAAGPALATELGGTAPALQIENWIKGEPVDLKDGRGENIYVVEFWATWCGPCKATIPHLTELQHKYKDKGVVIVGVTGESLRQEVPQVKSFVDDWGKKMDYRVAFDKNGETVKAYMDAFNRNGIPCSFVIDKQGRLVWHGHDSQTLGTVLDELVNDKFVFAAWKKKIDQEMELERRRQEAMPQLMRYFTMCASGADAAEASELGHKLLKQIEEDPQLLNMLAWRIVASSDAEMAHRDLELGMRAAKRAVQLAPKDASIVDTYARALWETGRKRDAIEQQEKAVKLAADSPEMRKELEKTLEDYRKRLHE